MGLNREHAVVATQPRLLPWSPYPLLCVSSAPPLRSRFHLTDRHLRHSRQVVLCAHRHGSLILDAVTPAWPSDSSIDSPASAFELHFRSGRQSRYDISILNYRPIANRSNFGRRGRKQTIVKQKNREKLNRTNCKNFAFNYHKLLHSPSVH